MKQWAKNLAAFAFGIACIWLMWRATEKFFHTLNEQNDAKIAFDGNYYSDFLQYDEVVGPKGAPNARARAIKKIDGKTIYDAVYSTDSQGRRNTYAAPPPAKERFLAFFGCSFTFGEGLQDESSLPWLTAERAPAYRVYNYGFSGYGPQQMLSKIESGEFVKETPEPSGVIIYVFIPHHVRRAIGSMRIAAKWGRSFPNYVPNSELGVVRRGTFTSGRPFLSRCYALFANVDVLRFFGVDFPIKLRPRHFELTADIIRRARDEALAARPGVKFYVLLYPDSRKSEFDAKEFIPYLKRAGVDYIDFSGLVDLSAPGALIEGDEHPSAKTNRRIAEALISLLQ
jgi:hypothetical protein